MKDENQGSGSGVMMIVLAVLGGLLLVGCCGGVVVLGGGMVFLRARTVEAEVMKAQEQAQGEFNRATSKMEEANEKLRQDLEAIKIPESPPGVLLPESVPPPETPPPAFPEEKEKE